MSVERAAAREQQGLEPRPIVEDGPWSPSTVLGILRNPRYAALSTYTPKFAQADGKRRRMWKAQILRGDAGEPIRGSGSRSLTTRRGGKRSKSSMTRSG